MKAANVTIVTVMLLPADIQNNTDAHQTSSSLEARVTGEQPDGLGGGESQRDDSGTRVAGEIMSKSPSNAQTLACCCSELRVTWEQHGVASIVSAKCLPHKDGRGGGSQRAPSPPHFQLFALSLNNVCLLHAEHLRAQNAQVPMQSFVRRMTPRSCKHKRRLLED